MSAFKLNEQIQESEFGPQLYARLKVVAVRAAEAGKKITLQCSSRTFREHFTDDLLIAGPWEWEIREDIPPGECRMYAADSQDVGQRGRQFGKFDVGGGLVIPEVTH